MSPSTVLASRGVIYSAPIAGTAIEESNINRHSCRICQKPVKDTNRQTHVGQHILKALCGVLDESVKIPFSDTYPCGTCGGPTGDGGCSIRIKSGKADSDCPSAYSFVISAAAKFHENRPCTNIPIACPLNCNEIHWKYNFKKHLEMRHPSWRDILAPSFLSQIQITRAEQIALRIPTGRLFDWPQSLTIGPISATQSTPTRDRSQGQKRSAAWIQNSPSRRAKENNRTPTRRAAKHPRLELPGPT
ncbi:hypothetical protein FB451DRAFT_1172165 [Mycena latifolia]|nr:hypothetical protein FB451DRAFT_1172165 [Mycena latifolia]